MIRFAFLAEVLLVALFAAQPAHAVGVLGKRSPCSVLLAEVRRAETALARRILPAREVFGFRRITPEEIRSSEQETLAILHAAGIHYERLTPARRRAQGVRTYVEEGIRFGFVEPLEPRHTGSVFEIHHVNGALAEKKGNVSSVFYKHPRGAQMIDSLVRRGCRVFLDPTAALVGADGTFTAAHDGQPHHHLMLANYASFGTLAHETGHFDFVYNRVPTFLWRVAQRIGQEAGYADLFLHPDHAGYGERRLLYAYGNAALGYPENANDEFMAFDAERTEAYRDGVEDFEDYLQGRAYEANVHLLADLAFLARSQPLLAQERRTFLQSAVAHLNYLAPTPHRRYRGDLSAVGRYADSVLQIDYQVEGLSEEIDALRRFWERRR